MRTITTDQINEILAKQQRGESITRTENFTYQGIDGTLNTKFAFVYTHEEIQELIRCAKDPIYFVEKYCKIQTDNGTSDIKLYGFQKEWITNYVEKRFVLQSVSDQTNYLNVTASYYLWEMVFNHSKSILIIPSKKLRGIDLLQKISTMYRHLPYFLKPAVKTLSSNKIAFSNGMYIKVGLNNFASNHEFIHMLDFQSKNSMTLGNIITVQACLKGFKLVVHSNPKTGGEFFKKLVENASRKDGDPQKNLFHLTKTYWWEVPNRDMAWREQMIKDHDEDFFNGYFDNLF